VLVTGASGGIGFTRPTSPARPGKFCSRAREALGALRNVATADDIARAVVVLASDELAGHVTGELVTVAGGMEGRTIHS
jgi:3-oxoacyl-[acyl-carrier protein] reductase